MVKSQSGDHGVGAIGGMHAVASHRRVLLLIGVVVAFSAFMAVSSASAMAAKGVVSFYGGVGTTGGKFGIQSQSGGGLAINQKGVGGATAGDLYVTDGRSNRVQVFSENGTFVRAFGHDVGGAGVDLCTVAANCVAATASGAAGGLSEPQGIAVDQTNGNVFVSDYGNRRIDVFSALGAFEGAFGWNVKAVGGTEALQFCTIATGCQAGSEGAGAGQLAQYRDAISIGGVAVSPLNGDILVTSAQNRRVDDFSPTLSGGTVTGVTFVRGFGFGAVNGNNEFQICTTVCHAPYVGADTEIQPGKFIQSTGVAVGSDGVIYVSDKQISRVQRFAANGTLLTPLTDPGSRPAGGRGIEDVTFDATADRIFAYGNENLVQEFEPDGTEVGSFGIGEFLSQGLAVNETTGTTYLFGEVVGEGEYQFGIIKTGEPVPPTVSIGAPAPIGGTTATFHGTVNPQGYFAQFNFEYSTDGHNWVALAPEGLPGDSVDHAVSQEATGLEAHTQYTVRLVAEKASNAGTASAQTTFTTGASAPVVTTPVVSDVSSSMANLHGSVDPENEAGSYRFQCVTESSFESSGWLTATDLPAGGAQISPAGTHVEVTEPFTGLLPITRYRCRLLASNPTGDAVSGDVGFVTYAGQGAGLPDGRVYEQATPVEKNGSGASGERFLVRAAADGGAITYFISGGGSTGEGSQDFPTYVASLEGGNWANHGLLPASSFGDHAEVKGWSLDLARDYPLVWSSGTKATFYVRDNATGAMHQIATGLEPFDGAWFAAESGDGNEVLFESSTALVTGAKNGVPNLYVWNRATDGLTLVDILPVGSPSVTGGFAGAYDWADTDLKAGGASSFQYTQHLNVLSEDGSTAFFTSANVGQLYARRNLAGPSADTVQVSESHKTDGSGPGGKDPQPVKPAAFMEATSDGRYVYFTSQSELTNDATTGSADQGNDLYRFDVQTKELIDVAPDGTDANGAEVQAVLGSSEDGSDVYFIANGVLASGATAGNCKAGPATGFLPDRGSCNIYLSHEGAIRFVAPITTKEAERDASEGTEAERANWLPGAVFGGAGQPQRTGQVEGSTLIFTSVMKLTAYDNGGFEEVYRYDPGEGLVCVSCIPSGQSPPHAGAAMFGISVHFGAPIAANSSLVRNITDGGRRIFFDSEEQLVATDINHVRDVYEWEASGTGSCIGTAENGGCIYLISSGTSPEPSYFADASASGDDVFFFTKQSLVGQDTDELQDVYDAKVGGGIPSQNPQQVTPCAGEACKGPAPQSPQPQAAGTSGFVGPGNPKAPAACKKGFVRKQGRCVKQKPKHHKKKHNGKKHHKKQAKQTGNRRRNAKKNQAKGGTHR